MYVFGDFSDFSAGVGINGRLFYADINDPNPVAKEPNLQGSFLSGGGGLSIFVNGFGLDENGEIYVVGSSALDSTANVGVLLKLTSTTPGIFVTDNSGATDDHSIQFTTDLGLFRAGGAEIPLVRPSYPDDKFYIEVTNTENGPLTLFEIQVNAPGVTLDTPLTSSPADDITLQSGEEMQFVLTFAPDLPSLTDSNHYDFSFLSGLIILSDADNDTSVDVELKGTSTFNSDITYDGSVNFAELGILNANFGKISSDLDFDPTADINGDGAVNFGDLGLLNVEFGRNFPFPPAPAATLLGRDGIDRARYHPGRLRIDDCRFCRENRFTVCDDRQFQFEFRAV